MSLLNVQNLSKNFGHIKAVNKCSFSIKPGNITAIVGPNGSGKTTLFNIISGITKQSSGSVLLDNYNIYGLDPYIISNLGLSRMFQHERLFDNLTVKENLLLSFDRKDSKFIVNILGLNKPSIDKVSLIIKYLKIFNLEKYLNTYTCCLSYGQKRLVEILRTLIKPHKILMLDEPTAGVNPIIIAEIMKLLIKLKKAGDTIIIIEHNMDFVNKVADQIILMNEGKILLKGSPRKVFKSKIFAKAYFS